MTGFFETAQLIILISGLASVTLSVPFGTPSPLRRTPFLVGASMLELAATIALVLSLTRPHPNWFNVALLSLSLLMGIWIIIRAAKLPTRSADRQPD